MTLRRFSAAVPVRDGSMPAAYMLALGSWRLTKRWRSPAGAETILSAGDSAFFDADVVHTTHHVGDEPTVALIPVLFETGQEPIIFHAHDEATPES